MLGHPGGEKHSRYLIELAFLDKGAKWLDMGAGDGSGVRLLRSLGYAAEGIDLEPRGKDVMRGNFLETPWQEGPTPKAGSCVGYGPCRRGGPASLILQCFFHRKHFAQSQFLRNIHKAALGADRQFHREAVV